MVSFQHRLAAGLEKQGMKVGYDLREEPYDAVLVVGGTRQLSGLWRLRRKGVRIVQRLDGMNWLHRVLPTGGRHFLRAEYGNMLLGLIRARFANHIVYQSEFSRQWWEQRRGPTLVPSTVVYNGVDLETFSPREAQQRPGDRYRLLLVEGSLRGGYEMGLEVAEELLAGVNQLLNQTGRQEAEMVVVGQVSANVRERWENKSRKAMRFMGPVALERIPQIDRSAHLLYSADINAACPNAVIEAMACGLPVLAFDTGALSELVSDGAGEVVPYGGDPWQLAHPDVSALSAAAMKILSHPEGYRRAARKGAEAMFRLDNMVDGYIQALAEH